MKKLTILMIVVLGVLRVDAQLNPVTWTFSAQKKGDKMYEIQMKATIQDSWHLFSQVQPEDAIAVPTSFTLNPNPLFKLEGKITESGKMEKYTDKTLGISANQYSSSVVFVQKVKMKANVKTNLTGSVEYQTCDDKKCLPPKKILFSIALK